MEKITMGSRLSLTQSPPPGESRVMYCGDCVTFTLTLSTPGPGRAWVRTNLGSAVIARNEIIHRVENDEIILDEAWIDIEMSKENDSVYTVVLPLHQTGFFQAKCFFVPEKKAIPVWPPGDNCIFNVAPAGTCCGNIIYNAFVRQFGRSRSGVSDTQALSSIIMELDKKGYTVIPESGKFRDLKKEVPFIFSQLGCRVLHLLPIHPTPTTYARMGRFGSPYAALNFTEVDPALAEFDPLATPLEQFMELVDTVHYHNGYLFMDIAINHTGWAASIHETNPEWLVRGEDGKIEAPGAWGVIWADLTKLDYSNVGLWEYMADVFLLWCHRGVDGFRCDAGYMVPVKAWEYIVAKVRLQYPETLFFLEGLGGKISVTREILSRANFNFAYSELFQNYTRQEISGYLPRAFEISRTCGHTIHFAETHDNNRLASVSTVYSKMRTSLCALFSVCGGFGFANGVEWFATQKIDVHESSSLNWGNKENQVDHISRLNLILKNHPAFFSPTRLELIQDNQSEGLVLLRHNEDLDKTLLILINLDCENETDVSWQRNAGHISQTRVTDLISGLDLKIRQDNTRCIVRLAPGKAMALTPDPEDIKQINANAGMIHQTPEQVNLQKLKAKVLSIYTQFKGYGHIADFDVKKAALRLAHDPIAFIRSFNQTSQESRVIVFDWDRDINRQVMIPPGFFLLVNCTTGFRAEILDEKKQAKAAFKTSLGYEEGVPRSDKNGFFALFFPREATGHHKEYTLKLRVFEPGGIRIKNASLLYLAPFDAISMQLSFTRKEIVKTPFLKLRGTTRHGGMMRAAAWWGRLDSRYDALLGANMARHQPENRRMVLSRYRIWAVYQGYSIELAPDCLETFMFSYDHGGKWRFHIPTSEGKYYALELCLAIDHQDNCVSLSVARAKSPKNNPFFLDDAKGVTIIIRPDIEDRSFHDTVKAFTGPETEWPGAVTPFKDRFVFSLSNGKNLGVVISKGEFVHEPEWHYMVHHPLEAQRGLDPDSDLFSPGYFTVSSLGGETIALNAGVIERPEDDIRFDASISTFSTQIQAKEIPLLEAVQKSLDAFIVERGSNKSVIAGYPWFLDWGRDSLIFCRSLIELKRFSEARAILRLFGRFENNGTLPNMICGKDAGNIETSDAPLWFFACCKDLIEKEKACDFLNEDLDGRSVKDILLSIARSVINGTKTGVVADPETFLLYSPSHFTWMDTNFPAGSPRQGYPVEIQALWYNALDFLASVDTEEKKGWLNKAKRVQTSVQDLFYIEKQGFFSDCLHSDGPVGAKHAAADDHLRPNQLFLFTLDVITDKKTVRTCVETCQEMIVPGAI